MKIKFLGTAAAEGFPAVFCNCEYCVEARKLGGKNVRTRSQTMINDDLLIDLPADTYHHFLTNGIEGDKIKHLIITHSHSDHLYVKELAMRGGLYSHNMKAPVLDIYCTEGAYNKIMQEKMDHMAVSVTEVELYKTFTAGDYEITPLPARHAAGDTAVIYIIRSDKTLLYANDTGVFYEEVFEYIEKEGIVFDGISMDCTYVDLPVPDGEGHMGFQTIPGVVDRLKEIGAVTDKTVGIVNHFSHNGNPRHDLLEKRAAEFGWLATYDGMEVEI